MPNGPFHRALPGAVRLPRHEGAYIAQGPALGMALDAVIDGVRYDGPVESVRGIVAPHIDLHRGWEAYGHAYGALHHARGDFDVYVILGTVHDGISAPFALTTHAFRTPFGDLRTHTACIDRLRRVCGDWVLDDAAAHGPEHSIEFQTLFLAHHAARRRRALPTIVPVLCGVPLRNGRPSTQATDFLAELRAIIGECGDRVCVIAAVDLAHMGPQFGDHAPLAVDDLVELQRRDRQTLEHVRTLAPTAFWNDVVSGGNPRRICGLTPLYAFLTLLRSTAIQGHITAYDQAADEGGSVVSYASVIFTA